MTPTKPAPAQESLVPTNGDAPQVAAVIVRPTPISVLQQAVERGASIETLEKLLALHERWEAREACKAFEQAFANFKAEAPRLEKTKTVDFPSKTGGRVNYKYTPLDVIANTLGPILAKHGLSYNWKQIQSGGKITVTCVLKHVLGHSDSSTLEGPDDPSGTKNPIQAIVSGVSYLRRTTLTGVLGMATSDEDSDGMTMGNAADCLENINLASNKDELEHAYKEAIKQGLRESDPKAIGIFMKAREKREKELGA
jgi:hypothetical protein